MRPRNDLNPKVETFQIIGLYQEFWIRGTLIASHNTRSLLSSQVCARQRYLQPYSFSYPPFATLFWPICDRERQSNRLVAPPGRLYYKGCLFGYISQKANAHAARLVRIRERQIEIFRFFLLG